MLGIHLKQLAAILTRSNLEEDGITQNGKDDERNSEKDVNHLNKRPLFRVVSSFLNNENS